MVMDLPGAFLHTHNDDDVIMMMTGKQAELMVMVAPQIYLKCISTNKQGDHILYIRVQKATYEMLKSALLFYKKLRHDLEKYGFKVNRAQQNQMTVVWHADDLKISHKKPQEITK